MLFLEASPIMVSLDMAQKVKETRVQCKLALVGVLSGKVWCCGLHRVPDLPWTHIRCHVLTTQGPGMLHLLCSIHQCPLSVCHMLVVGGWLYRSEVVLVPQRAVKIMCDLPVNFLKHL